MALLTTQQVVPTGVIPTLPQAATVTTGETFAPDDHGYLEVLNGSGGTITVTVTSVESGPEAQNEDLVVTLLAGARKKIRTSPASRFAGGGGGGLGKVVCNPVTTVTLGYFRV